MSGTLAGTENQFQQRAVSSPEPVEQAEEEEMECKASLTRDMINAVISDMKTANGLTLYCRSWSPSEPARLRGLICLAHGFGEHLGWYDELARRMAMNGFVVFGHDHRGHGRSEGKRAYIENTEDYVDDVLNHAARQKAQYPGLPMYLYGHSMGGLIAVASVLRNAAFFKGMILEGPLIIPDPATVTPVRLLMANLAGRILPEMEVAKIKVEQVTTDEETQARFLADKLRWPGGFKLRLALALISGLGAIRANLHSISLPFLILHGEKDTLCHPSGSHLLYKEASSRDKTLRIFPQANHHLILETTEIRKEVLNEVVGWLLKRSPLVLMEERSD